MSSAPKSSLFLVGMVSMASIWLLLPFFSHKAEPKALESSPAGKPHFQYAPPETLSGADARLQYSDEQVRRQLVRHAEMSSNGFYERIVDNPETHEAIRSRFQKERERLEALAKAHPELARESREALVPAAVLPDGSFSEEFKENVTLMKQYGVWDKMVENYLGQLEINAANPDMPDSMRLTPGQIEEVRRSGRIPSP